MTKTKLTKEQYLKSYRDAKTNVMISFNRRLKQYRDRESAFQKYFDEMLKVSPDFELVKDERVDEFSVFVDGFPVERIPLNYFDLTIKYVGKLPEEHFRSRIRIEVCEHHVSRRGSWRSTNEGYKVRTNIDYNESPYYKSGRTAAKKILEHVETLFRQENLKKEREDINKRAYKELSDKFPYKFIRTIFRGLQPSTFVVENANQTHITLSYNYSPVEDVITFKVIKVEVPSNIGLENLVESLGKV